MAASAEIFFEHDQWGRNLAWSAGLHVGIAVCIIGYAAIVHSGGGTWGTGGGGDAMGVTLVSSVPLPANPNQTQNVLANESKGLTHSEPKPVAKEPDAIAIPDKNAKKKPKPVTSESHLKPPPEPEPEANNVVPFGEGGPVSGPYGIFNAGGAKGGFGVTGSGGDFGTRFAFYVQQIQRKVSENWLKYEVDPSVGQSGQRVYITFDVSRDGHPSGVRVEQSSGVPSLDQSASRALQRIDTFGPLPSDYSGSKISVEFWFDYKR